jgi:hypothetical protein
MCPLLAHLITGFFSFLLLRPFTVLMKQTRQAVHDIKQSIFLDVYVSLPLVYLHLFNGYEKISLFENVFVHSVDKMSKTNVMKLFAI